jgi:hypothetical protein
MTDVRNPADRLFAVITEFKASRQDSSIRQVVTTALHSDSDQAVLRDLATVVGLPHDASEAIDDAAHQAEITERERVFYQKWRQNVSTGFDQLWNLSAPIQAVCQQISDADMSNLEAAALWLTNQLGSTPTSQADLAELRERATDLLAEVEATSALPLQLKVALVDQLQKIINALRSADFAGVTVLTDSSDQAVGAIVRTLSQTGVPSDEEGLTVLQKVTRFVAAVGIVAATVGSVLALPGHASDALELFAPDGQAASIEQNLVEP